MFAFDHVPRLTEEGLVQPMRAGVIEWEAADRTRAER
jgi:hypothetical protein